MLNGKNIGDSQKSDQSLKLALYDVTQGTFWYRTKTARKWSRIITALAPKQNVGQRSREQCSRQH